jgi:hypothetical protein
MHSVPTSRPTATQALELFESIVLTTDSRVRITRKEDKLSVWVNGYCHGGVLFGSCCSPRRYSILFEPKYTLLKAMTFVLIYWEHQAPLGHQLRSSFHKICQYLNEM